MSAIVFWEVVEIKKDTVLVRYWRKRGKTDALMTHIKKSSNSSDLKQEIEENTGLKNFTLVFHEDDQESN